MIDPLTFSHSLLRECFNKGNHTHYKYLKLHVRHFTECFTEYLNPLLVCTANAVPTNKELELNIDTFSTRLESSCIVLSPAMFSFEILTGLRLILCLGWDVPEYVLLLKFWCAHFTPFKLEDENIFQLMPTFETFKFVIKAMMKLESKLPEIFYD